MITPNLTNDTITGTLQTNINITGILTPNTNLSGTIISGEGTHRSYYNGSYEVIPKVDSQTLETKEKIMADDLEISSIPYFETSNQYGYTIYIGTEVEINGN